MPRRPPTTRGKDLFGEAPAEPKPTAAAHRANIDGGSRGNPGPAAYGVIIRDGRGEIVAKLKKYIGRMTNNVAEYYGLIAAMDYAQSHAIRASRIAKPMPLPTKRSTRRKTRLLARPQQRKLRRLLLKPNRSAPNRNPLAPNQSPARFKHVSAAAFSIYWKTSSCPTAWSSTFPFICAPNLPLNSYPFCNF